MHTVAHTFSREHKKGTRMSSVRTRRWSVMALIALLALLVPVAALSLPAAAQSDPSPTTQIRVVHAVPNAPPVDVFLNGTLAFANVAFTSVSDYQTVAAGEYRVQVAPAGAGTVAAAIDENVVLEANKAYTAAASGVFPGIAVVLTENNLSPTPAGSTRVAVSHLSPDAPPVDVKLADGTVLAGAVTYGTSNELDLPTGTYDVIVTPAGADQPVLLRLSGAVLEEGNYYSVFAVNFLSALSAELTVTNVGVADPPPPPPPDEPPYPAPEEPYPAPGTVPPPVPAPELRYSAGDTQYAVDLNTGDSTPVGAAPPPQSILTSDIQRIWQDENGNLLQGNPDTSNARIILDSAAFLQQNPQYNRIGIFLSLDLSESRLFFNAAQVGNTPLESYCHAWALNRATGVASLVNGQSCGQVAPDGERMVVIRGALAEYFLVGNGLVNSSISPGCGLGPVSWTRASQVVHARCEQNIQDNTLALTNPDGTLARTLAPFGGVDPVFSPDDQQVAFVAGGDPLELWVVNVDGSNLRKVTDLPREVATPPGGSDLEWW